MISTNAFKVKGNALLDNQLTLRMALHQQLLVQPSTHITKMSSIMRKLSDERERSEDNSSPPCKKQRLMPAHEVDCTEDPFLHQPNASTDDNASNSDMPASFIRRPRLIETDPSDSIESEPPRVSNAIGIDEALIKQDADEIPRLENGMPVSLYVRGFELILDTVLDHESHLFEPEELKVFETYRNLPYESRFLFVRLFMRKRGKWFRANALTYYNDVSNMRTACDQLLLPSVTFAMDAKELELQGVQEALSLLTLDELKLLATQTKCASRPSSRTKTELYEALCKYAREQCFFRKQKNPTLAACAGQSKIKSFFVVRQPETDTKENHPPEECPLSPSQRLSPLMRKITSITGPLIRLIPYVVEVFARLHIVFYRTTAYTESSMTTLVLARTSKRAFPSYRVQRSLHVFPDRESLIEYEEVLKLEAEMEECINGIEKKDLVRAEEIFESIYPRWLDHLRTKPSLPSYFHYRFTSAYVMTHIVDGGCYLLARKHDYHREVSLLNEMLDQRVYHVGRRGRWYDRLALIQMNHLNDDKKLRRRQALATCEQGLGDPLTHSIWHDSLQKRICRIEKALMIAKKDRHDFCYSVLRTATKRVLQGEQISEAEIGKKTIWQNRDGGECSVEELSLDWYIQQGWKGFHSENGIMTTMFGLLFWDVLFMDVDGAFETEFQTAPLDLSTDVFYVMRASEINQRLAAISNGEYIGILEQVDDRERPKGTWCVGVRWDYSKADILEIARCLGGHALSMICRLYAQEYGQRVGGLPDLCLWRMDEQKCMFVEVKGPGDRLSETQKTWIDALLGAGVAVELCAVEAIKEEALIGEHA